MLFALLRLISILHFVATYNCAVLIFTSKWDRNVVALIPLLSLEKREKIPKSSL